ncbi:seryl-tRNA synthetase [Chthoniobacter flavus Ellin428]|uniref:Serine--tRNA ligase n=1 Tax=Chthoniobacter flavus Ellin428 TaxID=497964 RepID=B4D0P8_9BACT|nr:serine--tRNA ligase [Chthoniobacter flavus]EDY19910.1 seryl-tRNA synthetase [Chthoniobacter flavus Ellin428]TCO91819.1 seryl-tRNA synthetase [Chthoniobacter flavus]
MLDIRLLREQPDLVKQRLATRDAKLVSAVDEILACDQKRRSAETRLQQLQADRKRISKEIGAKKAKGEDTTEIEAQVRALGTEMTELENETKQLDAAQRTLLLNVPNLPHDQCPVGTTAEDNPVVRTWGEKPAFAFTPKSHVDLGKDLGLLDFERATKISGSGFALYTGQGARLERALINFLLDLHTREHGYGEVSPPFLVNSDALVGTTQLPKFEEQQYRCERDDMYLVPTAEVPVTNLHREEILRQEQLPIRYAAYTPCFRREAGAAGLGTRGLIRIHQFDKVELVKITTPETSFAELESLTANAEKVLQLLGLHYRVIELCTGDIGFGSAKTYDIEVWAPGQNAYLEVSSCSNFGDFQARRMNLRFKNAEGKNQFAHTLNGSGTALPRLFVALTETYQQADGTIAIPEALRGHFGAERIG